MELHNLSPAKGSVKSDKRVGRGQGAGTGGTSTRGHKGAKSRSGYKSKRAFEGGQMPLQMRLPKVGFKNHNKVTHVALNLEDLQNICDKHNVSEISKESLYTLGYIKKGDTVKVLGSGSLTASVSLTVNAISASAKAAVEGKGGSVTLL